MAFRHTKARQGLVTFAAGAQSLYEIEKEKIISQIRPLVDQIIDGSEALDLDKALAPYSKQSIHILGGKKMDYNTFKESNREFFGKGISQKFNKEYEEFRIVTKEVVLFDWVGTLATIHKDKSSTPARLGVTLIFEFDDNAWKITSSHESW